MLNVNTISNFPPYTYDVTHANIGQCWNFVYVFSHNILFHSTVTKVAVNRSAILPVKVWTGLVSHVKTVVDATP
jgi:hypothetical protein